MTELTTAPAVLPEAASGCETADLILPWFEVQEGDLVLQDGAMKVLEAMWPLTRSPGWVGLRLRYDGRTVNRSAVAEDLTAVTRYVTTED